MKKEYTLTRKDGTTATFARKKDFDRAARLEAQRGADDIYQYHCKHQPSAAEERAEECRYRNKREAHRNACVALVQVAQDVDTNGLLNYHFCSTIEEHCAPNGWLTCKVPFNAVLNPDPNQKDFASMLGVGLVTAILFDVLDDAVAFKHFKGSWFTVGVACGVGEQVQLPQSLGEKLDALCARAKRRFGVDVVVFHAQYASAPGSVLGKRLGRVLEHHIKEVAKRIKKGQKLFDGHDIEAYFHGLNVARDMVVGEISRLASERGD